MCLCTTSYTYIRWAINRFHANSDFGKRTVRRLAKFIASQNVCFTTEKMRAMFLCYVDFWRFERGKKKIFLIEISKRKNLGQRGEWRNLFSMVETEKKIRFNIYRMNGSFNGYKHLNLNGKCLCPKKEQINCVYARMWYVYMQSLKLQ